MGSVKDLSVIIKPSEKESGIGRFNFSDRYSVFDWGSMPDKIVNKGKALCIMSAFFFELLDKKGIKSHYRGLFNRDGGTVMLDDLNEPSDSMAVDLYRVIKPLENKGIYSYSEYEKVERNFLIPLEIIYRNTIPEGSSVFRRLKSGEIKPQDIGLTEMPFPGMRFESPILDVSTKLETTDRYISWDEAENISGLLSEEIDVIKEITLSINSLISSEVERIGLVNEDGKIECAVNERDEIVVVDVFGTPDECRFTYKGLHVSKELARNYYRNTAWHHETEKAKTSDRHNWRSMVHAEPPHLPERMALLFSQMYQSVCNELTGRTWFEVPPLSRVMNDIEEELGKQENI